jgi:hypothetical protein
MHDPFLTIQKAVDIASDRDRIMVMPGNYTGATLGGQFDPDLGFSSWPSKKCLNITGSDGTKITTPITNSPFGPVVGFFIIPGHMADDTRIEHFSFDGSSAVYYPILGIGADGITASHLNIKNCQQGITNAVGHGWTITYNKITNFTNVYDIDGIGIFLSGHSWVDPTNEKNLVAFNEISSDTPMPDWAVGIALYVWNDSPDPPITIKGNKIINNEVRVINGQAFTCGIWLVDQNYLDNPGNYSNIIRNEVVANDCRGSTVLIQDDSGNATNIISRNPGQWDQPHPHPRPKEREDRFKGRFRRY